MGKIKVAFQNCTNLFPAGLVSRGPKSSSELQDKIAKLGDELKINLETPHLLGLCEVYEEPLVRKLLTRMGLGSYKIVFRPSARACQTGIAICYDPNVLNPMSKQ